ARLNQMIRKGTVCQGVLTCIAMRFSATKSTQATSTQDERIARRTLPDGTSRDHRGPDDASEPCWTTGVSVMFDLPSRLVPTCQRAARLAAPTFSRAGPSRHHRES